MSVRKRACRIIGELLAKGQASLRPEQRIECLAALLSHWPEEEDETLQDAQFKCLLNQWLLPCKNTGNCRAFADELSGLLKSPLAIVTPLQDFISRVVVSSSTGADQSLNSFLTETVNALLESLLRGLESSSLPAVKESLETITVLACQPGYLLDHLVLLHTLLRSEDVEVSVAALRLLHIVMPAASFAQLKKLETDDLERDLLGFIYRGSEAAVKLAIECLYLFVNNCSHQYQTLSSLWTRFSEFLKLKQAELESSSGDTAETGNTSSNTPANMARALIALGVLGAQSALHSERELGVQDVHTTPQIRSLLAVIQFYCGVPWPFVRTCALSALCSLLQVCPQLAACWSPFAELMTDFLTGPQADDSGRSKILSLLSAILNASSSSSTDRSILKMEGKESFHSALTQSLLPQLCQLSCASSGSFAVKAQALKLASSAAVLGFVNPHQVLPFVCVGMASADAHLQAFSQASFERLMGRFPSLAPRDLLQISRLIWNTQPQARGFINSPCPLTGKPQSQSLLSALYTCLRSAAGKKTAKLDLLSGMFGFFERLMTDSSTTEAVGPEYIAFLVEVLVTLPFQGVDEVSLLLMKIQSLFPLAEELLSGAASEAVINGAYVALHGFSAALGFLLRCFPSINATCLQEDQSSAPATNTRSLTRVAQLFTWKHPLLPVNAEALDQLISQQTPIAELLIKAASSAQRNKKRALDEADVEAEEEEIQLEDDCEEGEDDEDGGASSEEFEAMLMNFNSQKKNVIEKQKEKQKIAGEKKKSANEKQKSSSKNKKDSPKNSKNIQKKKK